TTEPNSAPECTALSSPPDGATDVPINTILQWNHSVGNQQGYKISIGTTPGGTQILNAFNVGNVTSYDPGNLPTNTTLYVRITPYWAGGDITGCEAISLTIGGVLYCASDGLNSSFGMIGNFSFGEFNHPSGSQGYSDFTDQTKHISASGSYSVSNTPQF